MVENRLCECTSLEKMFFTFAAYILVILVDVFSYSKLNSMHSIIYNWDRSLQNLFYSIKPALNSRNCIVILGHNLDILQKKVECFSFFAIVN